MYNSTNIYIYMYKRVYREGGRERQTQRYTQGAVYILCTFLQHLFVYSIEQKGRAVAESKLPHGSQSLCRCHQSRLAKS